MSKICALQLATQPMSDSRLDYYFKMCADEDARLVVLGEYVLNSFFKELETMPKSIIKEQSERKKESLLNLASKYDLTIVAPFVLSKGKEFIKVVAKFNNSGVKFHEQQILMPYSHWNEAKFFNNAQEDKINFMTFMHEKFKIGVMFGYESHFDPAWAYMMNKKVDIIVMPTASTFFSENRWEELLKTRAFTNNTYILRVNRVGNHKVTAGQWNFYGDTMLIDPLGEVEASLGNGEEMLLAKVSKQKIGNARNLWEFRKILHKRGLV
ncbi:carbon-nitrogen hydrolase family protein [Campylobacter sp. RM16187]|uniref:carbon-nitrogen hydrolase family protein n=1 Tax=Campylobacter sp. RM16187 TaxID=1660063 RepID=UPI0021B54E57|nr:carbon-nitrogen hydrolase family protein [Campylobacter sp. RM16187]QKG28840.1 hydrolase, carbon-nitrogen family [Campylobacter sp. RM16187]